MKIYNEYFCGFCLKKLTVDKHRSAMRFGYGFCSDECYERYDLLGSGRSIEDSNLLDDLTEEARRKSAKSGIKEER